MARRYQHHAYDDENQLTLDFRWEGPASADDGSRLAPTHAAQDGRAVDDRSRSVTSPNREYSSRGVRAGKRASVAPARAQRSPQQGAPLLAQRTAASVSRPHANGPAPDCTDVRDGPMPVVRSRRNRASALTSRDPGACTKNVTRVPGTDVVGLRRNSEDIGRAEYVAAIVDYAPPLSGAQRDRIAGLLAGSAGTSCSLAAWRSV